jgi:hypothetical protein
MTLKHAIAAWLCALSTLSDSAARRAPYNAPLGDLFLTLLAGLACPRRASVTTAAPRSPLAATIHKPYCGRPMQIPLAI